MEMWFRKLIQAAIAVDITVHLLLYIYEVPDNICECCHFEPANPNKWLQRATMYFVVFLWAQLGIEKLFNRIVASVMAALVFNEVVGNNQDWGINEFIGLACCLSFPFLEAKLVQLIKNK